MTHVVDSYASGFTTPTMGDRPMQPSCLPGKSRISPTATCAARLARIVVLAVTLAAALLSAAGSAAGAASQQDMSQVQIETQQITDGVYMLVGSGGNIGVLVGDDGVIIVDDQYAPLTDKIRAAIEAITDKPIWT